MLPLAAWTVPVLYKPELLAVPTPLLPPTPPLPPTTSMSIPVPVSAEIKPSLTTTAWLTPTWPPPRTVWPLPSVHVPPVEPSCA